MGHHTVQGQQAKSLDGLIRHIMPIHFPTMHCPLYINTPLDPMRINVPLWLMNTMSSVFKVNILESFFFPFRKKNNISLSIHLCTYFLDSITLARDNFQLIDSVAVSSPTLTPHTPCLSLPLLGLIRCSWVAEGCDPTVNRPDYTLPMPTMILHNQVPAICVRR